MKNPLTNEQAKTIAEFIYRHLDDYIKANEIAFHEFISNIKNKGRKDD